MLLYPVLFPEILVPHKFLGETVGPSSAAHTLREPVSCPPLLKELLPRLQSCLQAVKAGLGVRGFSPSDRLQRLAGVEGTFARSNPVKTALGIRFWS